MTTDWNKPFGEKPLFYRCRHFTGIQNKKCRAGIPYPEVPKYLDKYPCNLKEKTTCEQFDCYTEAELIQQREDLIKRLDAYRRGESGCCGAPLDESQVIKSGRFKNHGPRFCSKCGKVAFMV